ncbi:MAG: hypothetical protein JSW50_09305 [Candidatus Latescibacterota bacterium]|nr:MAG: hypothetical protein JSW50_09305 [Candidatus Latescibacterota bacterium]
MALRIVVVLFVFAVLPAMSWGQATRADEVHLLPGPAFGDSSRVLSHGSGTDAAGSAFRTNTERPLSMYLARNSRLLFGYEIYRASKLECAWQGVGVGMTMGMCAGALGMTAGVWDERTSWYIAGAMAAVGAIFGVSKAGEPQWNVRIRWDPNR